MYYDNLKNKDLWKNFALVSSVPRESGNEEGIRNTLLSWAKEHKISAKKDEIGNVIMTLNATPGYESVPSLLLQGHMDMVCVKKEGSKHNFKKDPIEIEYDGKYIKAKDTSLGGDNGIAIAFILTLFEDKTLQHGKLEALFTVSEETKLLGASNIKEEDIHSRLLLNLDSEEEGVFYIGCAGGMDAEGSKEFKRINTKEKECVKLSVSGLLGGHSGGEIHKERANAISVLSRALMEVKDFSLSKINGGTRRNVIPSTASAIITINDKEKVKEKINALNKILKKEYALSDPDITIKITPTTLPETTFSKKDSESIVSLLYTLPHGVDSMSLSIPGIVETSDNLAIVETVDNSINIVLSIRSSVDSKMIDLSSRIITLLSSYSFTTKISDGYPSWTPNPDSTFTRKIKDIYKKINGKDPVVTAIHAGLECGIINKKIPGMDSVSIGPNLFDVHSVNEKLDAESAERTYEFLKDLLKELK